MAGVNPELFLVFKLTLTETRNFTTSSQPHSAAACKGVSPTLVALFRSIQGIRAGEGERIAHTSLGLRKDSHNFQIIFLRRYEHGRGSFGLRLRIGIGIGWGKVMRVVP